MDPSQTACSLAAVPVAKPRARPGPKPKPKLQLRQAIQGSAPDPFINLAPGLGSIKPDDASRRFIRSHVMKGRNRKPTSTRAPLGSWINNERRPLLCAATDSTPRRDAGSSCICPHLLPSDLRSVTFAIDMKPQMLERIFAFFDVMKNNLYSIERFIDVSHFDVAMFDDLGRDAAYVHSLMFMVHAYFDIVGHQNYSHQAIVHMTNAVNLLQKTLANDRPTVADSTLFVVLSLATVSEALGDLDATAKHRDGLHQILKLRGGITTLKDKPALQLKACRLDLAYSVKAGCKPLLFSEDTVSWNAYLSDPAAKRQSCTAVHMLCAVPDVRLVNVWIDMREFCMAINLSSQTQQKVKVRLYQEVLISAQYRLQFLGYDNGDEHEVLRVGMLAFTTTLFFEIPGVPVSYVRLAKHLKELLRTLEQRSGDEWLKMTLWLLFAASVSVMRSPEDRLWLQKRLLPVKKALQLTTWVKTREVLKNYLWVDVINDDAGKAFFLQQTTQRQ